MTKNDWKKSYSAYRLFWRKNGEYWTAANAHKKRTVTAKQIDTLRKDVPDHVWRIAAHVQKNAPRHIKGFKTSASIFDGRHYYTWLTLLMDDRPGYRVGFTVDGRMSDFHYVNYTGSKRLKEMRRKFIIDKNNEFFKKVGL